MIRGLYTSASGMQAQQHRMDALSNNLANADLVGYKKDTAVMNSFPEMLIRRFDDDGIYKFAFGSVDTAPMVGTLGMGVECNEIYTNFNQGSLKQTENTFDLALEDDGFFVIDTPQGERYTRNGSFIMGKEHILETKDGFPVMGENGQIEITKNFVNIDKLGRVWQYDDPAEEQELIDTIQVVGFRRNRFLNKQGNSFWDNTEISGEPQILRGEDRPGVLAGFLESANVNPVNEMVNMIEVNRAYEANQKMISAHDNLLGKLVNDAAVFRG